MALVDSDDEYSFTGIVTNPNEMVAVDRGRAGIRGSYILDFVVTTKNTGKLSTYRAKRTADRTPEPFGQGSPSGRRFVVQQHAARRMHYDLRLELDGVLKSWAVPKGPSPNPADKRLAVLVEDHPLEYEAFEGSIPDGNYGAGAMIVWDRGDWRPLADPIAGLASGKLLFQLNGYKLRGKWTLVKTRRGPAEWLLIKERDAYASTASTEDYPADSVLSGRTVEQVGAGESRAAAVLASLERLGAKRRAVAARSLRPMLATPGEAFSHPDWVFELKYDGYRLFAEKDGARTTLFSRAGNELTSTFPELASAVAALPYERFILDAEATVHDERGLPSFQRLQKRGRLTRRADVERAALELPANLYVFDLLYFEGFDLRALPLVARKDALQGLLPTVGPLRFSEHVVEHGAAMFAEVERMGLEGIVAKRAASTYVSRRSKDWIKVNAARSDDFVVLGFAAPRARGDRFAALLLGQHRGGTLVYAGRVGSGFTQGEQAQLGDVLAGLERAEPPAAAPEREPDLVWVAGGPVVQVRFKERTHDGLLRQPVLMRRRDDKRAADCVWPDDDEPGAAGEPDPYGADSAAGDADRAAGGADSAAGGADRAAGGADSAAGAEAGAADDAVVPGRASAAAPDAPASAEMSDAPASAAPGRSSRATAPAVPFTNLDKLFWPSDGYTKRDLVEYYEGIAPWLLPYLRDRPVVLTRYPDGIAGKSFFQKDAPAHAPSWLRLETMWSEHAEREIRYFVLDDLPSLLYVANMASIPLHVWSSRVASLERPDWCILDLDPKGAPLADVVKIARFLRELCASIGLPSYTKTSGSSGVHVLVPLGARYTYEQSRTLAEVLARVAVNALPGIATIERHVGERGGKVYLDYLQNGHGKLLVAPLSVRPLPGAPVSMPLAWSKVTARLSLARYNIRTARGVLVESGDPLAAVLADTIDMSAALDALQGQLAARSPAKRNDA